VKGISDDGPLERVRDLGKVKLQIHARLVYRVADELGREAPDVRVGVERDQALGGQRQIQLDGFAVPVGGHVGDELAVVDGRRVGPGAVYRVLLRD